MLGCWNGGYIGCFDRLAAPLIRLGVILGTVSACNVSLAGVGNYQGHFDGYAYFILDGCFFPFHRCTGPSIGLIVKN